MRPRGGPGSVIWPELPGTFTMTVGDSIRDFWTANRAVVLVEQDVSPFGRYAGWLPIPRDVLAEPDGHEIAALVESGLDHIFRPWRYPDKPAIPTFDLFPRAARVARWVRRRR